MRARVAGLAGVVGATGAAVFTAVAAARARERRAADAWEQEVRRGGPEVDLRGERVRLPFAFHRSEGFTAVVGGDADRVAAALPSSTLHPVLLADGRAAILVAAYHHRDQTVAGADGRTWSAQPYAEVMVAVLVTPRPAPPVAPLFAPGMFRLGGFVLHLPVTSRLALDAGRLWSLPKFVADMAFTEDAGDRSVRVSEGGREILSLRVRPSGAVRPSRAPMITYSVRDWELLRTSMPGVSLEQTGVGRSGGRVELGDHPVAESLRALGLSSEPFATTNVVAGRFLIPAGHVIGAAGPYLGYAGVERDFGRYTVGRAGTPPIDQYAGRDRAEWWVVEEPGGADRETAQGQTPEQEPAAVR